MKKLSLFLGNFVVLCELCKLSHQSRRALARARRAFKNLEVSASRFAASRAALERGVFELKFARFLLPRNGMQAVRKANDSLVSLRREFGAAQRHTGIKLQRCLAAISVAEGKARAAASLADECLSTAPDFRTLRVKAAAVRARAAAARYQANAAMMKLVDMMTDADSYRERMIAASAAANGSPLEFRTLPLLF